MKKIFLLSTFVLTQTIFATTLTIYNTNIALVHESCQFKITKGEEHFIYDNITDTIISNSVNIEFPPSVKLYSQIYKKKSLTQYNLAKTFIGKEVTLKNSVKIKLLNVTNNSAIVQDKQKRVFSVKISDLLFPYLPKQIQKENSLDFTIKATKNIKTDIDISYLARDITFSNDYIININKNRADIEAWVTITNNSKKTFKDTTVHLVAGDINRAYNQHKPLMYKSITATETNSISHKAVAGYHKYTLPSKINLKSYEKRRVKLLTYKKIPLHNSYIAILNNPLYLVAERSVNVIREIQIKNLDRELPSGVVRIYTKDDKESLFLGESNIANTPPNSKIRLKIGKDFDTKIVQKVISRNDTTEKFDATIEYKAENYSNEDKIFTLQIPFNNKNSSKIISKLKYSYTKGNYVTFRLKVKAKSEKSFRVNFKSKRR